MKRWLRWHEGDFIILIFAIALVLLWIFHAQARDNGQWATDNDISQWIRSLMQPDNPMISCCGDADAYWADSFKVKDGQTIATITDTRDDDPLGRPHRPFGTEFAIPDYKMKWDAGNPTGHGWLFLSYDGQVYCYVTPGGV